MKWLFIGHGFPLKQVSELFYNLISKIEMNLLTVFLAQWWFHFWCCFQLYFFCVLPFGSKPNLRNLWLQNPCFFFIEGHTHLLFFISEDGIQRQILSNSVKNSQIPCCDMAINQIMKMHYTDIDQLLLLSQLDSVTLGEHIYVSSFSIQWSLKPEESNSISFIVPCVMKAHDVCLMCMDTYKTLKPHKSNIGKRKGGLSTELFLLRFMYSIFFSVEILRYFYKQSF